MIQASGVIVSRNVVSCTYVCPVENREAPLPEDSPPGPHSGVLYDWVTIDNTRTYLRERENFKFSEKFSLY